MKRLLTVPSPPALGPAAVDRWIVAALVVGGLVWAWPGYFPIASRWSQVDWIDYLGPFLYALLTPLPLLVRRTQPVLALGGSILALAAAGIVSREPATPVVGIFLGAYSVGRYTTSRTVSIGTLIGAIALGAIAAVHGEGLDLWFIFMVAILVGIWLTGDTARTRDLRAEHLEERAARHEAEAQSAAARAADDERTRIARELHDVIAHNVSVMVVQAAAAGRVIDADPDQARASLATIEATGREALTEMRRLLGVLRAGEPSPSAPQPSLVRLPELVAEMQASGLPVELTVVGTPRPLPPGVDLSAYRVVQEALTNALRHAGPSATRVVVRYDGDALDVEIVDQGRTVGDAAAPGADGSGGHGLAGMRERVALVRGELEAGPRPGGGFRVRARLPIDVS
ncbi:MAG: sensor histidine kinase [Candidatus Limnocylindrales bacterium]